MAFFELIAKLGADTSGFMGGMKAMEGAMGSLKGQLAQTFGAQAVFSHMKQMLDHLVEIREVALQTDRDFAQLRSFEAIWAKFGLGAEDAADALKHLSKARDEALGTDKFKANIFASFGIDKQTLENVKDVADLIPQISKGMIGLSKVDKATAMRELFAKSGSRFTGAIEYIGKNPSEFSVAQQSFKGISHEDASQLANDWKEFKKFMSELTMLFPSVGLTLTRKALDYVSATDSKKPESKLGEITFGSMFGGPGLQASQQERMMTKEEFDGIQAAQKTYQQIADKVQAAQYKLMTGDEQRADISKRIGEAKIEAEKLENEKKFDEASKKRLEIQNLKDAYMGTPENQPELIKTSANALQRIGAENTDTSVTSTLRSSLEEQRRIRRAVEKSNSLDATFPNG